MGLPSIQNASLIQIKLMKEGMQREC